MPLVTPVKKSSRFLGTDYSAWENAQLAIALDENTAKYNNQQNEEHKDNPYASESTASTTYSSDSESH